MPLQFNLLNMDTLLIWTLVLNPLSPNSDQHQFSPKDIHRLSREMVMRINKMITKEKMYGDQFGEFVCVYSGLKG